MEHLFNCHGEWTAVLAAFTSFGTLKLYWNTWRCKHDSED